MFNFSALIALTLATSQLTKGADIYTLSREMLCNDPDCWEEISQAISKVRYAPPNSLEQTIPELFSILMPLSMNEEISVISKSCGRINNNKALWFGMSLLTGNRGCFPSDAVHEKTPENVKAATEIVAFDVAFVEEEGFFEKLNKKLSDMNDQKEADVKKYNDNLKLRHHFANLLKGDKFLTPMTKLAEERFNKFRVSDPEKAKIYNECILLASILLGKKDISVLEGWPASISASEDSVRYRLADIAVWSQTNFMFEPGTWIDTMDDYMDGQPKPKAVVKEEPKIEATAAPIPEKVENAEIEGESENSSEIDEEENVEKANIGDIELDDEELYDGSGEELDDEDLENEYLDGEYDDETQQIDDNVEDTEDINTLDFEHDDEMRMANKYINDAKTLENENLEYEAEIRERKERQRREAAGDFSGSKVPSDQNAEDKNAQDQDHERPDSTEQTEKDIRARQVANMREEMRVNEEKRLEEETRLREEHREAERLAYETEKDIQEAIRVKEEMDRLEAQEAVRKELLAQALKNLEEKEEADKVENERIEKESIEKEKTELEQTERVYQEELRLEAERETRRLDVELQQKQLSDKQEQLARQMQELEAEEEGNKQKAKDEAAQKLKDMINHENEEVRENTEENDAGLFAEAETLLDDEVSEGVFPTGEIQDNSELSENMETVVTDSDLPNPEILTSELSNDNNLLNENIEKEESSDEQAEPEIKEEKGSLFGFVSRLLRNPSKTENPVETEQKSEENVIEETVHETVPEHVKETVPETVKETVQEQTPEKTESHQESNFEDGILNDNVDSLMAGIEMDLDGELELETNEHLVQEIENSDEPVNDEQNLNQDEVIETETENLFEKVEEEVVESLLQEDEIDAIGEEIDEALERARENLQENTQENMQGNNNEENIQADNILEEAIPEENIQEIKITEDPKIQENHDDKSGTHGSNDESNQTGQESEVPEEINSPAAFSEEAVEDSEVEKEYLKHFEEAALEGEQEKELSSENTQEPIEQLSENLEVMNTDTTEIIPEEVIDVNIDENIEINSDINAFPDSDYVHQTADDVLNSDIRKNLKLLDIAFMSENWLFYLVTIVQCYLVFKLIQYGMNYSKGPLDFLEVQIEQIGATPSDSSNQTNVEDEAKKEEEIRQLIKKEAVLKGNHSEISNARNAWVDRNNQWNDFFKNQKKSHNEISSKTVDHEKSNSKNKTKIINLETSHKNHQTKHAKLQEEMATLNEQFESVDSSALDQYRTLETEFNNMKTKKLDLNNQLQEQQVARTNVNKLVQEKTKELTSLTNQLNREQEAYGKFIKSNFAGNDSLDIDEVVAKLQTRRNFSKDLDECRNDIDALDRVGSDVTIEQQQRDEKIMLLEQQIKQRERDRTSGKKGVIEVKMELEFVEEYHKKRDAEVKQELIRFASGQDSEKSRLDGRIGDLKTQEEELSEQKRFHDDYKNKFEHRLGNIPHEIEMFSSKCKESEEGKTEAEKKLKKAKEQVDKHSSSLAEIQYLIDEANCVLEGGDIEDFRRLNKKNDDGDVDSDEEEPKPPGFPMMGMPPMVMTPSMMPMPSGMNQSQPSPGNSFLNTTPLEMQFNNVRSGSTPNFNGSRNSSSELELKNISSPQTRR